MTSSHVVAWRRKDNGDKSWRRWKENNGNSCWDLLSKLDDLVGGLEHEFCDFPYIGNNHHPSWQTPSFFQRGRYTTNQWLFFFKPWLIYVDLTRTSTHGSWSQGGVLGSDGNGGFKRCLMVIVDFRVISWDFSWDSMWSHGDLMGFQEIVCGYNGISNIWGNYIYSISWYVIFYDVFFGGIWWRIHKPDHVHPQRSSEAGEFTDQTPGSEITWCQDDLPTCNFYPLVIRHCWKIPQQSMIFPWDFPLDNLWHVPTSSDT